MTTQPTAKGKAHPSPKPNDGQVEAVTGELLKKNGNNGTAQLTQDIAE